MKKKTSLYLSVFLILAVLTLGIGYAAISKDLQISGNASATANDENFNVKFDATVAPVVNKSKESFTATATYTDGLNAKINVAGLSATGDYVTATYTIKNESPELGASLAVGTITNGNDEYFKVTTAFAETSIAHGASTTITVTVELIKTPIVDQTAAITVPIKATAVAS